MKAELIQLPLVVPFRIAQGSSSHRVMLRVEHEGLRAEAPFVPYYNDDPRKALEAVNALRSPEDPLRDDAPRQAKLVLDLLRHAQQAQAAGVPIWTHLQLPDPNGVRGCRSIGIPDDLAEFADEVAALAAQFSVIKLKLGSGSLDKDMQIAALAREAAPSATLLADANGGWSVNDCETILPLLTGLGLELVEQPVDHRSGLMSWRKLRGTIENKSAAMLIADESAQTAEDVPELEGLAGGVNVKLLKCGGISGALRMIETARSYGMKVMLGCMIETQIGITYAAQLAGLADWIDLDGHFYLPQEGVETVRYDEKGNLVLL